MYMALTGLILYYHATLFDFDLGVLARTNCTSYHVDVGEEDGNET